MWSSHHQGLRAENRRGQLGNRFWWMAAHVRPLSGHPSMTSFFTLLMLAFMFRVLGNNRWHSVYLWFLFWPFPDSQIVNNVGKIPKNGFYNWLWLNLISFTSSLFFKNIITPRNKKANLKYIDHLPTVDYDVI